MEELKKFSNELKDVYSIDIAFSDSDSSVCLARGEDVLYVKMDDIAALYGGVVLFMDGGQDSYKKAASYLAGQFEQFLEENTEEPNPKTDV